MHFTNRTQITITQIWHQSFWPDSKPCSNGGKKAFVSIPSLERKLLIIDIKQFIHLHGQVILAWNRPKLPLTSDSDGLNTEM